jgi:hypothetical protein
MSGFELGLEYFTKDRATKAKSGELPEWSAEVNV